MNVCREKMSPDFFFFLFENNKLIPICYILLVPFTFLFLPNLFASEHEVVRLFFFGRINILGFDDALLHVNGSLQVLMYWNVYSHSAEVFFGYIVKRITREEFLFHAYYINISEYIQALVLCASTRMQVRKYEHIHISDTVHIRITKKKIERIQRKKIETCIWHRFFLLSIKKNDHFLIDK